MAILTAKPEGIDIEPAQTALVVVDMQNAFAKPGGMLDLADMDISGAAACIETNRQLLDAARSHGVQVVYLQMTYAPDLSNGGGPLSPNYHKEISMVMMRKRPELSGKLLVEGSWDWQIVDELAPRDGDMVIPKIRYSGFCGTGLNNYLRTRNFRYLLFTGIATNVCVESTARDAYFEEYWPIIVEDAVNHAGPDFTRQAMLWNFENIFGWVTTAANIASWLNNK